MKKALLVFITLYSQLLIAQDLEGDRLALVAFYNSTNGNMWYKKTGWSSPGTPGESPCSWYGVTCNTAGDRVESLILNNNGLDGPMPAAIGNLKALKNLTLKRDTDGEFDPSLSGDIPVELGNLVNLEYLDLSGSFLSGSLPVSLGNLIKLKYLDLHYIPMDPGFDRYGGINGSIPSEFGNLVNLEYLNLNSQQLSGSLPVELGNLTKLSYLNLGANLFSGTIPSSYSNLENLRLLILSYLSHPSRTARFGGITGPVPDFSATPSDAKIHLQNQSLNFDGLEVNASRLAEYSRQAKIPLDYQNGSMTLAAEAGGKVANNTYKWYRNNALVATVVGNKTYLPTDVGTYRVEVSNSLLPSLTLVSVNKDVISLPVGLIYFSAKPSGNSNILVWETSWEKYNQGFEIEKSADAKTFKAVGFVDGNGGTDIKKTYRFEDTNPFGITYYRLRQIDRDQSYDYSNIIVVKRKSPSAMAYPNPATGKLFFERPQKGMLVTVTDLSGKVRLKQTVSSAGNIDIETLEDGIYIVHTASGFQKIIVRN